jgi:hypothetical protein
MEADEDLLKASKPLPFIAPCPDICPADLMAITQALG